MAFDFEVRFEFLCAFVPPKPFDENPDYCSVVLPDFTNVEAPYHPHHACVLYHRDHRVPDHELEQGLTPRPAVNELPPDGSEHLRLIQCEGEEIEIRPNGEAPIENALKMTGSLPNLFRIEWADDKLKDFRSDLVEDPKPAGVAARLRLRQGQLDDQSALTEKEFQLYEDESKEKKYQIKMARAVSATFRSVKFVDLVFRKFSDPNGAERVLRLQTADPSSTVKIRNCEWGFRWKEDLPGYDEQDTGEINLFFTLSAGYDQGDPPPLMKFKIIPTPAAPNGICAPKAFSGVA